MSDQFDILVFPQNKQLFVLVFWVRISEAAAAAAAAAAATTKSKKRGESSAFAKTP